MSDFNDDGWKMTPSHNVKSVEDFLADTSSAEVEQNSIFKTETSLEDSLSDWGIAIPEVITKKEEKNDSEEKPSSILDHLGTGFISGDEQESHVHEETQDLSVENSLPSEDDLGYPDEATGEFEFTPEPLKESRSLFNELSEQKDWSVSSDSDQEMLQKINLLLKKLKKSQKRRALL